MCPEPQCYGVCCLSIQCSGLYRAYTKGQAHCGHGAKGATEGKAAINLGPRETTGQGASTVQEVTGMCYMLGEMLGCKDA